MWKLILGVSLCSIGTVNFGLSFQPQVEIINPNPLSSYQQPVVKRKGQGTALIYALGAIALGTGFIGSGLIDLNQLNKQRQEKDSLITSSMERNQPIPQPQISTNIDPTTSFVNQVNPATLVNQVNPATLVNQVNPATPITSPVNPVTSPVILEENPWELSPSNSNDENNSLHLNVVTNNAIREEELTNSHSPLPTPYSLLPNMGCVGIVGHQKGSGKTSKLAWLVAEHIKRSREVWVINPFCPAAHFKGVRVWGKGLNYKNAAIGIRKFAEIGHNRIKRRGIDPNYDPFNDTPLVLILDELSNYSSAIDKEDPEAIPMLWDLIIQFIRQANMFVAFASHGDTQALLGGNKALAGKSEAIKIAINWIYAQAQIDPSVPGNYRCAGWADFIEEGGKAKQKINIPNWLQAPNPKFDYTQIIAEYCPQLMFTEGLKIPTGNLTPEQFKRKLMENENV